MHTGSIKFYRKVDKDLNVHLTYIWPTFFIYFSRAKISWSNNRVSPERCQLFKVSYPQFSETVYYDNLHFSHFHIYINNITPPIFEKGKKQMCALPASGIASNFPHN